MIRIVPRPEEELFPQLEIIRVPPECVVGPPRETGPAHEQGQRRPPLDQIAVGGIHPGIVGDRLAVPHRRVVDCIAPNPSALIADRASNMWSASNRPTRAHVGFFGGYVSAICTSGGGPMAAQKRRARNTRE